MSLLGEAAKLWDLQASYTDAAGRRRWARREAILATLRARGASVETESALRRACRERRRLIEGRLVEPVVVAWDGRLHLDLGTSGRVRAGVALEDGRELGMVAGDGSIRAPDRLPLGYHRLQVAVGRRREEALLISAPSRGLSLPRTWGVFLPLYALHSRRSWGVGDLRDLGDLAAWVAGLGGGIVATTPLLAAFLDEPFEPGPYAPASRLFWNELFLALDRIPEVGASPKARRRLGSLDAEIRSLRRGRLVDHRRAMALKRRVLEAALADLTPGHGRDRFDAYVRGRPALRDYARFRAALEVYRAPWPSWPSRQRAGRLTARDAPGDAYRYHLFVQWVADDQLADVRDGASERGVSLALDLPMGCHPAGYDAWRERGSFAMGASAGAPPDVFFAGGQEWGFPPPHPDGIREDGYRYLRSSVRHGLSRAGILRVDHIMSFHRLFWVPHGFEPRDGVYVRYRPDELYAVLLLEAHRAGAVVMGEDLGTVPPAVRRAMDRHGVARSFALQTELGRGDTVPAPGSAAALNTHDMPTFEAFRRGWDIDRRETEGWLRPHEAAAARQNRTAAVDALAGALRARGELNGSRLDRRALVEAILADMGRGSAGAVIVGLEDLWLETEPQNVPGTVGGRNWRRKIRLGLERLRRMDDVVRPLTRLDRARRNPRSR